MVSLLTSCGKPPKTIENPTLKEAKEKFLKICEEELNVEAVTSVIDNTLWIYIPIDFDIISLKAADEGPSALKEAKLAPTVNYLDAQFNNGQFLVEYDISLTENYPKSYGYDNSYSEQYQTLQQGLLSAINRSYYNIDVEFVIFVITDIKNGIETENIINLLDLKKALSPTQTLPQDEFIRRYISDIRGDKAAINDSSGKHINMNPIAMADFIAKQIVTRINFKYQRSVFPPSSDTQKELLIHVKDSIKAYQFKDYESVVLKNLRDGTQVRVEKDRL